MLNDKMNNIPSTSLLLCKYFLMLLMLELCAGFRLSTEGIRRFDRGWNDNMMSSDHLCDSSLEEVDGVDEHMKECRKGDTDDVHVEKNDYFSRREQQGMIACQLLFDIKTCTNSNV